MVLTVNAGFDIFEGVVRRLIRWVGKTDQAFRLGDGHGRRRLEDPDLERLRAATSLGRLDHPELIWRRGFSGYFAAARMRRSWTRFM
jgi:hypothetical protein